MTPRLATVMRDAAVIGTADHPRRPQPEQVECRMAAMDYCAYRIQWVLSFTEEDRAGGFCGTTTHHGATPAAAAIASAETACRAVAEDVVDLRFFILGIVDENHASVELSNDAISSALHRHASDLEFEVAYRPLC